jgi:CMP-N-acetylneuraminic acid synthetase/quercetin dioxygenase-like cupin family protein
MKIVAMIPARLGSKRVPRKNLRLILGKPLISYSIEAAKESGVFDEIYVNSESDIFGEIAAKHGVRFYKRSEELSDDKTINDEFLLDFVKKTPSDICVQLLPTSPLIRPEEIRAFVEKMVSGSFDTLVSVERHQIASVYMGDPINFRKDEAHRSSQEMEPVFSYATVLMGWRTATYLQSMAKIGCGYHGGLGKTGYFELSGPSTIDIDEEDDFAVAEVALRARHSGADARPQYYEPQAMDRVEADVPSILKRDGVLASDFSRENQPVVNLPRLLREKDSSVSWCHRVVNTESNSATVISQLPGEGNRLHYHPDWNEWWYILKGEWEWCIDNQTLSIKEGDLVFIPKGIRHKITAKGDRPAVRLAVSRADVAHVYPDQHQTP